MQVAHVQFLSGGRGKKKKGCWPLLPERIDVFYTIAPYRQVKDRLKLVNVNGLLDVLSKIV